MSKLSTFPRSNETRYYYTSEEFAGLFRDYETGAKPIRRRRMYHLEDLYTLGNGDYTLFWGCAPTIDFSGPVSEERLYAMLETVTNRIVERYPTPDERQSVAQQAGFLDFDQLVCAIFHDLKRRYAYSFMHYLLAVFNSRISTLHTATMYLSRLHFLGVYELEDMITLAGTLFYVASKADEEYMVRLTVMAEIIQRELAGLPRLNYRDTRSAEVDIDKKETAAILGKIVEVENFVMLAMDMQFKIELPIWLTIKSIYMLWPQNLPTLRRFSQVGSYVADFVYMLSNDLCATPIGAMFDPDTLAASQIIFACAYLGLPILSPEVYNAFRRNVMSRTSVYGLPEPRSMYPLPRRPGASRDDIVLDYSSSPPAHSQASTGSKSKEADLRTNRVRSRDEGMLVADESDPEGDEEHPHIHKSRPISEDEVPENAVKIGFNQLFKLEYGMVRKCLRFFPFAYIYTTDEYIKKGILSTVDEALLYADQLEADGVAFPSSATDSAYVTLLDSKIEEYFFSSKYDDQWNEDYTPDMGELFKAPLELFRDELEDARRKDIPISQKSGGNNSQGSEKTDNGMNSTKKHQEPYFVAFQLKKGVSATGGEVSTRDLEFNPNSWETPEESVTGTQSKYAKGTITYDEFYSRHFDSAAYEAEAHVELDRSVAFPLEGLAKYKVSDELKHRRVTENQQGADGADWKIKSPSAQETVDYSRYDVPEKKEEEDESKENSQSEWGQTHNAENMLDQHKWDDE